MISEIFAIPCVGAIVEKVINGQRHILLQTRCKCGGGDTNGKLELPAGKIREYEGVLSALRREVFEETGLTVTKIVGEDSLALTQVGDVDVFSVEPFCVTQNLSGAYSIVLLTFICEAVGDLLESTDETQDIKWVNIEEIRKLIVDDPNRFFFMHINALKKYLLV